MVDNSELSEAFEQRYGSAPRIFHAPGRVNLMGEHTDYNEGYVLPMAIDRGTSVAIAGRTDSILRVWSLNLQESIDLDLERLGSGRQGKWIDYIEGIAAAILAHGISLTGANIALKSDLTIGGGLSSSAALEIGLGTALLALSNCSLDRRSLAFAGQTAEHRHVGINCGIMDQFTSVFAMEGQAMLLDCRTLETRNVPLHLREYEIVIADSRVRHALASSEYNQRRRDCEMGVEQLSPCLPEIRSLRDVSALDLESHQSRLAPEVLRRCRHVVSENARTLKAADALASEDVAEMGRLMVESHASLRDDYQVSCRELDLLVDLAIAQSGVLGSRMTGGGFGGYTISLVESDRIEAFREEVSRQYQNRIQAKPEIFVAEPSAGAREITGGCISPQHK